MAELFSTRSELKIGRIVEVNGNSLRIELDNDINELVRAVDGKNYPIGQVGSVIKIHCFSTLVETMHFSARL